MVKNKTWPRDLLDLGDAIVSGILDRVLHDKPPELPFEDYVSPHKLSRKHRRARAAQRKARKFAKKLK